MAALDSNRASFTDAARGGLQTELFSHAASAHDPRAMRDAFRLPIAAKRVSIPSGRTFVTVEVPPGELVSIAVFGPKEALLAFEVLGVIVPRTLDEDSILPRVASFRTSPGVTEVRVLVDASAPVDVGRIAVAPMDPAVERAKVTPAVRPQSALADLRPRPPVIHPLIGLPTPSSGDEGYLLQSPARYQFLRIDVAATLVAALRQTRVRFRRDAIAIADISQWDGVRPATDIGRPRHISHEGGRDVDMALPSSDAEPSIVRPHCNGVLVESDVQGCAPGTARGVDAVRLAYLLGLLVESSPGLERIYTDDVYVREFRNALDTLRKRRWIHDVGYEALLDDALVRASPWHTDHIHLRFAGKPGRALW
jgi:hypothetical protein